MNAGELLARLSQTLRKEIGPAVTQEYPKTQAFMAAVVTQKLGKQLALAPAHERARATELDALLEDLANLCQSCTVDSVNAGVRRLRDERDDAALSALIETLYATRSALDEFLFDTLLNRIRKVLRAEVDRRMEYAA